MKLDLRAAMEAMGGQARSEIPSLSITGVSTDSRAVAAGELFFAIRGANFDGHRFVGEALQRGAVGAVIQASQADVARRTLAEMREGIPAERGVRKDSRTSKGACAPPAFFLIEVDDTIAALGQLAAQYRRSLQGKVIAVVGSNGKTTTKAMIDHILSARLKGRCSPKSFNNNIGVPLTLFSAEPTDDYVVVEIGTNAPGEVAALARIARPDGAVITAIGEEHLEGLKDLNGVAAEECSILKEMRLGGFVAANSDAPEILPHLSGGGPRMATFGRGPNAQFRVTNIHYEAPWLRFDLEEPGKRPPVSYRLPIIGPHNAVNAAGAIALARHLGFAPEEIAAQFESFTPPPMRMETQRLGDVTLINDAYNANPHSALAAVEVLESLPCEGRRILVFGEMRELGEQSAALHRKVAERFCEGFAKGRLDRVLLVGVAAELMHETLRAAMQPAVSPEIARAADPLRVERFETVEQCAARLADSLAGGDTVLLKASRAVGLERCADLLRRRRTAAQAV